MGFIKNFNQLALTTQRKTILNLIEAGLSAIQPNAVVNNQVHIKDNILFIQNQEYSLSLFERITLVGFGKGSAEVCRILEQILGDKLTQGFDIDVIDEKPFKKISYTKGTHPLPSQTNIDYTQTVLKKLENLSTKDLVLVVICGGGSVLFERPQNASLNELISLVDTLLKSGANISQMNIIRKHLSMVKGGGLAKLLYPATIASLIFSDVPGNNLSTIASGPTVKDLTTISDVEQIIREFDLKNKVDIKDSFFKESISDDKYFKNVYNFLLVSNDTALFAMQQKAIQLNIKCSIYSNNFQSDAKTAGNKLLNLAPSNQITLFGGETTVHVKGSGQGGRNQTLILASLPYLEDNNLIASFDSDGWDFTTLAGAIGDKLTIEKAKKLKIDPKSYLDNDDSLAFFQMIGDGIDTGKLESNVSDIFIVYKY